MKRQTVAMTTTEPNVTATVSSVTTLPTLDLTDPLIHQNSDPVAQYVSEGIRNKKKPDSRNGPDSCSPLIRQWKRLFLTDQGILIRRIHDPDYGVIEQLVLPDSLKDQLLYSVHDKVGHQGIERTYMLARKRVYWPNMFNDIKSYCQNCVRCNKAKLPFPKPRVHMPSILASKPLKVIATDLTVLGKKYGWTRKCPGNY